MCWTSAAATASASGRAWSTRRWSLALPGADHGDHGVRRLPAAIAPLTTSL